MNVLGIIALVTAILMALLSNGLLLPIALPIAFYGLKLLGVLKE